MIVFYDGGCKYCAKEISHYRNIASSDQFTWVNISQNPDALTPYGIRHKQALLFLHVIDNHNQVYVGVDAFIRIWTSLPRWYILAKVIHLPGIYHLTCALYKLFARWRFNHYGYCHLPESESKKDNQEN